VAAGCVFVVCRVHLTSILSYLQSLSAARPSLFSTAELTKALQPSSSSRATADVLSMPAGDLAVVAPQLLALLAKSAVLLVMSLLTELLVVDQSTRNTILQHPGTHMAPAVLLFLVSQLCKQILCQRCPSGAQVTRRSWQHTPIPLFCRGFLCFLVAVAQCRPACGSRQPCPAV
jgi:hypothetical protein